MTYYRNLSVSRRACCFGEKLSPLYDFKAFSYYKRNYRTPEATWTTKIAVSQKHIFRFSTQKCNAYECTWLQVFVWSLFATRNTELARPPISHTGLVQKSYEKASCLSSRLWTLETSNNSGESLAILWTGVSRYDKMLDLGETAHVYLKLKSNAGNHFFFFKTRAAM